MSEQAPLAAVIVGAGLAGLSCAVELGRADALVLEAGDEPGGRVATRRRGVWSWERGASFAYNPALEPAGFSGSAIDLETGPIMLEEDGRLLVDREIRGCVLAGLEPEARERDERALTGFAAGEVDFAELGPRLRRRLAASFAVLHPGPITDYLPNRQRDALLRFANRSRREGNGELIAGLQARLPCPLRLRATVTALEEDDAGVTVRWREADGTTASQRAEMVVLAVPAPIAGRLLPSSCDDGLRARLRRWPVYGGEVVSLGLRDVALPDFSYLVSTRPELAAVIQRRPAEDRRVLSLYFVDGDRGDDGDGDGGDGGDDGGDGDGGEEVGRDLVGCLALLGDLGLGTVDPRAVELFDRHRWPVIGAAIGAAYQRWDPAMLAPTRRIRLAGDWTHLSDGKGMPYGMVAAAGSGRRIGGELRALLDAPPQLEPSSASFGPLATSTMLAIEADGPRYLGRVEDGDVAYWGLVLAAEGDPAIARYLWSVAVDDTLWEYHRGYGSSAADSAFAIEGLLAAGEPRERLRACIRAVAERYHDRQRGGFATVLDGRAPYWAGASADTTAHVLWLLALLDPQQRERIAGALDYLLASQGDDGLWPSRWFPSRTLATHLAVRAVAAAAAVLDRRVVAALARARLGLLGCQRDDGSWEGSVIDTAAALLALADPNSGACRRGGDWLRARAVDGRWAGEPILSYWFDLPDGERRLYLTVDHGRVTGAWATLALRALGR